MTTRSTKEEPIGAMIDRLKKMRVGRQAAQMKVDALKATEDALELEVIGRLTDAGLQSGRGQVGQATIIRQELPTLDDFDALARFIKKTGDFDLLHRRLAVMAVRDRWEQGKVVPGVGKIAKLTLSLTAVKDG